MSEPKVLDWHRAASAGWYSGGGDDDPRRRLLALHIAAHDPHDDLHAEVARLRKALEWIVKTHSCTECETNKWGDVYHGSQCPALVAAAALEGKE